MREDRLSARELEIARAYANGETYRQIADRYFIAPSTVRTHVATIYRKLEVSSKLELHRMLEGDAPQARSQSELAAMMSELALSLEESISREKALSRVLKIISASEGDIDGVIASVLDYALELCDAEFGIVFDYKPQNVFRAAHARGIPKAFRDWFDAQGAFRVGADTGLGRLASRQTVVNIVDVRSEGVYRSGDPLRLATADLGGARSFTAIPMQAGDRLIGAFTIYRQRVHPFDDRSLQLANTFADQSVIAIENARMLSRLRSASGAHV